MSQHIYKLIRDGKEIEVRAGWDRPLQYVFLTVESCLIEPDGFDDLSDEEQLAFAERCDEENEFLYNNLLTPVGDPRNVRKILQGLGIPIPEGFVEAICQDADRNEGNKVVHYGVQA